MYYFIFILILSIFMDTYGMEEKRARRFPTISEIIVKTLATYCVINNLENFEPFDLNGVNFDLKTMQSNNNQKPFYYIIATIKDPYPNHGEYYGTHDLKGKILETLNDCVVTRNGSYVPKLDKKTRYEVSYDNVFNSTTGRYELCKEIRCFVFMK